MEDIKLRAPKSGATVDLRDDVFRWTEIPGVKYYEVQFAVLTSEPNGASMMSIGPYVRAQHPELKLSEAQVSPSAKQQLQDGSSATWCVVAYDVNGRRIGISTESARPFVVAGELK